MAPSSFDVQTFLDYLGGDRELAAELLAAFAEDAPQRLQALARAVAANNAEDAVRAAHSLKGMCGVLKDEVLTTLALGLEMSARKRNLDALATGLPLLRQALDTVLQRIAGFLTTF